VIRASARLPEYALIPDTDNSSRGIPTVAIVLALLLGVLLSLVVSALIDKKVLNRVARVLCVTQKFGDRDVWSYIMNAEETTWLVVRDRNAGVYYVGQLSTYSDEERVREIVLDNTEVFDNETGESRYTVGKVYFSFLYEGITIELHPLENRS